MINPPARPQVKDGSDLFVTADLLVWQAHENGLPLAVVGHQSRSSPFIEDGKVANFDFDCDVGFRIGVGYNLPHDGWDLSFNWLRFYTDASRHVHANDEESIFRSLSLPASRR